MSLIKQVTVFIFLFNFSSAKNFASTLENNGWLAFGDLRGYFEPCGCDPEADLGGVARQIALIEREIAIHPNLLLFNLGTNLPTTTAESYKITPLLAALTTMRLDAYLVNELELSYFASHQPPKGLAERLVLSNEKGYSTTRFKPVIEHKNAYIFGFFFVAKWSKQLSKADEQLLKKWRSMAKDQRKPRVLLFAGDDQQLAFLQKSKWFDLIISANTAPLDTIVGPEEKEQPDKLIRHLSEIWMTPIGGQGILRGGVLRSGKAPLLSELLKSPCNQDGAPLGCSTDGPSGGSDLLANQEFVTWLDKSYRGISTTLHKVTLAYEKAARDKFGSLEQSKKQDLANSPFAGAESCQGCHQEAYQAWKKSRHAHALSTLSKVNRDKDPECVSCHVVGFNTKGGFASVALSPHLANVQCENCHGPRKDHISNPIKDAKKSSSAAKEVCVSCHFGTHTAAFDYNSFWKKISHGLDRNQKGAK